MMEHGYYHPDLGYWQAVVAPTEATLSRYPKGTIKVPRKPGEGYEWQDGQWIHVSPSDEDLIAQIRARRASLLTSSDWTQLPDCPLSDADRAAWASYRQALRDLTETEDLSAVVWPVPPST